MSIRLYYHTKIGKIIQKTLFWMDIYGLLALYRNCPPPYTYFFPHILFPISHNCFRIVLGGNSSKSKSLTP